jgi:DNA-binding PadR family transcriptional regulator
MSIYRSDIIIRVLDLAILGLLMERDHHGYEIRAQLRDRLGMWANVSFGSIYPALARLERDGDVEVVGAAPLGKAASLSTGSLAGERASIRSMRPAPGLARRGRKVYSITEHGRSEFARLLADPATLDDSRAFSLRMALARYLSPSLRVGMLEQRRLTLIARLGDMRQHADGGALDGYARSVMEHHVRSVELEIDWVDKLLANERAQRVEPQPIAREAEAH